MAASRSTLAAIAATAVVTAVLANTAPVRAVSTAIQTVFVVNTTANPVPVHSLGTTAVSGTVGLSPTGNTVQVRSSAASPVVVNPVDAAPTHPWQLQVALTPPQPFTFTIPVNERLVIQYVNGTIGCGPPATVHTTVGGVTATYSFGPQCNGERFDQQVSIYGDPGTNVIINSNSAIVLSGYLVSLPSGS